MKDFRLRDIRGLNSRNILGLFLLISIFTIGLSIVCGPDPRIKIYIFAKENTLHSLSRSIEEKAPGELIFYSPSDDLYNLDVLVRTRTIKTIIIADYPLWQNRTNEKLQKFLRDTIGVAEQVIVVEGFTDCELASETMLLFPERIRVLSESAICETIRGISRNTERSYQSYMLLLKVIAVSSLALVSAGAAFAGSQIPISESRDFILIFARSIFFSSLVFVALQMIYLMSSMILETPLSLHYTYVDITAISTIGPFRGGTFPRIFSAALGLMLGILSASGKQDLKISPTTILLSASGLVLLLTAGIKMFSRDNLLATLLYDYGIKFYQPFILAGKITQPEAVFSRGVMMTFPGLIPLGVVPRMRNRLQSITIAFSIVAGSWGLMRIGDLRYDVALRSFLPGIVLGIILSLLLIRIDRILSSFE